jgi:hypothetical protein
MWKYSCPASNLVCEFHSFKELDECLTAHEVGINVSGGIQFPEIKLSTRACQLVHNYWDDGEPCGRRGCKIPYIGDGQIDD